jgi:hypothetical protein
MHRENVSEKCNESANLRESELQALVVSVVELLEQLPGLGVPAEKTFHALERATWKKKKKLAVEAMRQ